MERLLELLKATKAEWSLAGGLTCRSVTFRQRAGQGRLGRRRDARRELRAVLPVLAYENIADVLSRLTGRDKPLALYVYARTRSGPASHQRDVFGLGMREPQRRSAGRARLALRWRGRQRDGRLPRQGGFETFSHAKSVLYRPERGELPLMYPQYRAKRWVLRKAL